MDEFIGGLGNKVVELSQDKWMKLAISMLIDIIGILTFLIPVVRPARVFARERASGSDAVLSAPECRSAAPAAPHGSASGCGHARARAISDAVSRPLAVCARGVAADM